MRIAHIVAHGGLNGVATSCKTLIEAQLAAGHDILLATFPNAWLSQNLDLSRITLLESNLKTRPKEISRVGFAIRDWGCDVVHCHGSKANKYGLVYRFTSRTPIVATAHANLFQLPWAAMSAVIAPSQSTLEYHRRKNHVPARRLHKVFNIVPKLDRVDDEDRRSIRRELGVPEDAFLVGMVGAIGERKNQIEALRILKLVAQRVSEAHLVLVGSYSSSREPMPGWNNALAEPDIASRVTLTGARPDAHRIMNAFNACLFVSSNDPGPLSPLESMTLGVPLVAYEVGCLPEIIVDGVNGYLLNQLDRQGAAARLIQLRNDAGLARMIGSNGSSTIAKYFSSEAVEKAISDVYRSIKR